VVGTFWDGTGRVGSARARVRAGSEWSGVEGEGESRARVGPGGGAGPRNCL
jgi:hypothetical protein